MLARLEEIPGREAECIEVVGKVLRTDQHAGFGPAHEPGHPREVTPLRDPVDEHRQRTLRLTHDREVGLGQAFERPRAEPRDVRPPRDGTDISSGGPRLDHVAASATDRVIEDLHTEPVRLEFYDALTNAARLAAHLVELGVGDRDLMSRST